MKLSKTGENQAMSRRYKNTFRNKALDKIQSLEGEVVLWSDLNGLGSSRQISRALKDLVEDGVLIRIGRGLYAKATPSKYIDEPIISGGFDAVCLEALRRLNVRWELGQFIRDYNEGRSQQVPAHLDVRLKSRFRRTLTYGNNKFRFEGNINAR